MTLRIGLRTSNSTSTRAGFTLVELILVMAILIVVLAVAAPSLQGFFHGRHLNSEAQRLLALTRYGQSRAVSEGIPMVLWIDARQGTYGLEAATGYLTEDTNALEYAVAEDLTLDVPNDNARLVTTTYNVSAAGLSTALPPPAQNRRANLPVIRFSPDGSIDPTSPEAIQIEQADANREDELWIAQTPNRLEYSIESTRPPSPVRR